MPPLMNLSTLRDLDATLNPQEFFLQIPAYFLCFCISAGFLSYICCSWSSFCCYFRLFGLFFKFKSKGEGALSGFLKGSHPSVRILPYFRIYICCKLSKAFHFLIQDILVLNLPILFSFRINH